MATVEKIRKDIEKTKEKISAQQKRLRELEAQLTEEENLEIVRMVKAVRMDNKELTAFLKKPSIKERLEQSRKECANQSKAQPHREKSAPEL